MSASTFDPWAKPPRMTVDEFIIWSQVRPGRYELLDGEVVTMQAERIGHVLAKAAVYRLLFAVRRTGVECTVLQDGAAVKVDEGTTYEPDCTIHCGPLDRAAVFVANPVVVIEVLSRSTQAIDTGIKLAGYFKLSSVQHYLVVDADKKQLIHFRRDGQVIATHLLHANEGGRGVLTLDPPGITVAIADFFADLEAPGDDG